MELQILGEIADPAVIAKGVSLRVRTRLYKVYGPGKWRKLKGRATVRLPDGFVVRAEVHWYEAHGVRPKRAEDQALLGAHGMSNETFVLCIKSGGYSASLEQRKVYRTMSDPAAEGHGMVRVVDESGEDYLFPTKLFVPIAVPTAAAKAFARAAGTGSKFDSSHTHITKTYQSTVTGKFATAKYVNAHPGKGTGNRPSSSPRKGRK